MGLKSWLTVLAVALALAVIALCYFKDYQYIEAVLLWLLVLFPGAFLGIVHQQYRSILQGRKDEIKSIMGRGNTFSDYLKAFESSGSERSLQKTMDRLFYRKFGRSKYHFPLGMNAVLGGLFVLALLIWSKAPMHLPADITARLQALPLATVAGLSGAFIWGLYDVLRRFEAVDLSPAALHSIWLRMLVASVLIISRCVRHAHVEGEFAGRITGDRYWALGPRLLLPRPPLPPHGTSHPRIV